jgi:hypothetical protein
MKEHAAIILAILLGASICVNGMFAFTIHKLAQKPIVIITGNQGF